MKTVKQLKDRAEHLAYRLDVWEKRLAVHKQEIVTLDTLITDDTEELKSLYEEIKDRVKENDNGPRK